MLHLACADIQPSTLLQNAKAAAKSAKLANGDAQKVCVLSHQHIARRSTLPACMPAPGPHFVRITPFQVAS